MLTDLAEFISTTCSRSPFSRRPLPLDRPRNLHPYWRFCTSRQSTPSSSSSSFSTRTPMNSRTSATLSMSCHRLQHVHCQREAHQAVDLVHQRQKTTLPVPARQSCSHCHPRRATSMKRNLETFSSLVTNSRLHSRYATRKHVRLPPRLFSYLQRMYARVPRRSVGRGAPEAVWCLSLVAGGIATRRPPEARPRSCWRGSGGFARDSVRCLGMSTFRQVPLPYSS